MRKYEKPVIEVVELRPEERLAAGYKTFTVNNDQYTDFYDFVQITNNTTGQSFSGMNIEVSGLSDWIKKALKWIGIGTTP